MRRRLCLAAIVFCSTILCTQIAIAQSAKKSVFAVFWVGCDETCLGFQHYFSEKDADVEIIIRDADRDKAKLPVFLEEARAMKADLILTYGTSVSLGIAGTLDGRPHAVKENKRPYHASAR